MMIRNTRLLAAVGAAVVAVAAAAGVVAGVRDDGKRTPCEAAVEIVDELRGQDPATVGYTERNGGGYGLLLLRLITGGFDDIEGEASPVVAEHLRTVADDLATVQGAPADEFRSGKTGRDMDALVAACE